MKKVLAILGLFIILSVLAGFIFWGLKNWREVAIIEKNLDQDTASEEHQVFSQDEINILFLGLTGNDSSGANLTDAISVLNLNLKKKKAAFIGIPRDLWVKIGDSNGAMKINGLFEWENASKPKNPKYSLIQDKISQITGLNIDYVIILDLDGFRYIVDSLGGINIYIDKEIVDPQLKNPDNPSEIFKLEPGWRYLDGKTAAKFIRTRYAPEGDFSRIHHQQQMLIAIKNKVVGLFNVWGLAKLLNIYRGLDGHIITNLNFESLIKLAKLAPTIKEGNTEYLVISNRPPDNLLISTTLEMIGLDGQPTMGYVLLPRLGFEKYDEIHKYLREQLNKI